MAFRLSIEDGPYEQTLQVSRDRLRVGRDAGNDLRLTGIGVSDRHCTIRQNGNTLVVTDLHSKTGLVFEGRRQERIVLRAGDTVELGATRLTVVFVDGDPPPAEPEAEPARTAADAPTRGAPPGPRSSSPPNIDRRSREPSPQTVAAAQAAAQAVVTAAVAAPEPTATELAALELVDDEPPPRGQPAAAPATTVAPPRPAGVTAAAPAPAAAATRRVPKGFEEEEFGDLIYQAVRQSPWWLASVVVHAVALLLLTLVQFSGPPPVPPVDAVIGVGESVEDLLDETPDVTPESDRELPFEEIDRPMQELIARELEPEPDATDEEDEAVTEQFASPDSSPFEERGIAVIGTSSSAVGAGELSTEFGKDDATTANRRAAAALEDNAFTRALLRGLRVRTTAENVRVVKGQYDECERIFEILGLAHGWITLQDFERGMPPETVRIVFINCSGEEPSPQARRNIEAFVRRGGYLFTTDWGVDRIIEKCFGGTIASIRDGQRTLDTHDETVAIEIEGRHELLKGLPEEQRQSRWWLEDSSHPFVIRDPSRVEVLIQSAELAERWKSGLVAVTFRHGKGRVVHAIGHLYQREGNLRGAHAMQRLLLNFLYRGLSDR